MSLLWPLWDGAIGQEAKQLIEANGNTKMLGVVYRGMRQFTSAAGQGSDDVKGLNRLPMLETWAAVWQAIGASPVPIPSMSSTLRHRGSRRFRRATWSSCGPTSSMRCAEVHLLTNHHVQTGNMSICADFYYSLDEDTQRLIDEAAKEATEWGTQLVLEREQQLIENMKEKGCTILETDAEAFRQAGAPAVEKMFTTHFPVTTWDEINKY